MKGTFFVYPQDTKRQDNAVTVTVGDNNITLKQHGDIIVLDEKQTKQLIRELIGEFK